MYANRRGIVSLTDDTILANGVFANIVPGLDPDTVKMYQLLVDGPTVAPRNERLFLVLQSFKYLGEKCSKINLSREIVLRAYGAWELRELLEMVTASLMQNMMQIV